VSQRYEAPQGAIEQALAAIWQELLKVQRVGRDDDVFELGGHSLLAMQIVGRIRASLAVDLPVRFLFQFPTVRQLALQVEQLRGAERQAAVAAGTSDAEELLERVASLPESEVQELLKELRTEARS
jgi:acyl carrier protein